MRSVWSGALRLPVAGLVLTTVLGGCGLSSSSPSPTANPIVITATPKATPRKVNVVITSTPTPKLTQTPKPKATHTPKPTAKPTRKHKTHRKATATPRPTAKPTRTPKPTPRPTAKPHPSPTHHPRPTPTTRPRPTKTPKPHPTATLRPRPTRTPLPKRHPTATPTNRRHGPPTPVPTSRPLSSVPRLGVILHSAAAIAALQGQVTAGKTVYLYNTNPIAVLEANLSRYGFINRFRIAQPIKIVIVNNGRLYDIYLEQLVKRTFDGAWFIVETARHAPGIGATPVPHANATPLAGPAPKLGIVHHTAASTAAVQSSIDAGQGIDAYYLNPILVMDHNLGAEGFKTPVQVQLPLKILVNYQGKQYDVLLAQPAQKGEKGIWVISSITRHHA